MGGGLATPYIFVSPARQSGGSLTLAVGRGWIRRGAAWFSSGRGIAAPCGRKRAVVPSDSAVGGDYQPINASQQFAGRIYFDRSSLLCARQRVSLISIYSTFPAPLIRSAFCEGGQSIPRRLSSRRCRYCRALLARRIVRLFFLLTAALRFVAPYSRRRRPIA